MPTEFTPLMSTAGGLLVGVASSLILLVEGRVAGISGIVGGVFAPRPGDTGWRLAFVAGLLTVGGLTTAYAPALVAAETNRTTWMLVVAGLLVGFGTRLGNGCTSGHGVCGLSRFSGRSLASVLTFMAVGALVAIGVGQLAGAA